MPFKVKLSLCTQKSASPKNYGDRHPLGRRAVQSWWTKQGDSVVEEGAFSQQSGSQGKTATLKDNRQSNLVEFVCDPFCQKSKSLFMDAALEDPARNAIEGMETFLQPFPENERYPLLSTLMNGILPELTLNQASY